MLRSLYDLVLRAAAHRLAMWWLGVVAFFESSVFPIPVDAMLIPMVVANREKVWMAATVCTVFSVLGGLFGYAIGLFFFDAIGEPILNLYGYVDKFKDFSDQYNEQGAIIVLIGGLTPVPYKVITIASGVTKLDLAIFTAASVFARGVRFFAVAWCFWYFGPRFRRMLESNLAFWTGLMIALLIGGFVFAKYWLG